MNNGEVDVTLWAYTAGRYKGKCAKLEKEVQRLREEIERRERVEDCLRCMIGLIVEEVGEVVIYREAIDEGRPMTQVDWDEESQTYTLRSLAETE